MEKQEIFDRAKKSIVDADEEKALELISIAEEQEVDLLDLLINGFGAGNDELGDNFDKGVISLPELIYAAEVMKNVTGSILEILETEGKESDDDFPFINRGTVVLATVAGDVHDIGKGIVASTLRAAGFEVIDLGCEVPVEKIVEEAKRYNADIIGTSALLTSTLTEQKKLEKLLAESDLKASFITMVGGAPCTPRWAKKIGADGYSEDAIDAVKVAISLIEEKKKE
ncbi:MAG: B12-binding domain-containing protein [Anaerovoracaceae bacterium]